MLVPVRTPKKLYVLSFCVTWLLCAGGVQRASNSHNLIGLLLELL